MRKFKSRLKAKMYSYYFRIRAYIRKLLFPIYLFPIKFFTYLSYYLIRFIFRFTVSVIKMVFDAAIFPFRGLKNFTKTVLICIVFLYIYVSLFVITDYLRKQYGYIPKFFCSYGIVDTLKHSVVRVVGRNAEGSGFFISSDKVITSFHVIDGEYNPKIIFPDGTLITPVKITGNRDVDIAVLHTEKKYKKYILPLSKVGVLVQDEPLLSAGYPMGTQLSGPPTILRGNYIAYRFPRHIKVGFIQTNISLIPGMSGGPLVDQCGRVFGINTIGIAGLSLFISVNDIIRNVPKLTAVSFEKTVIDPSVSPQEAVKAFYTYLRSHRMKEAYNLLSSEYKKRTNFNEWISRFKNIIDIDISVSKPYKNSKSIVFVKFTTKVWVEGETEKHYYEGTWQTVKEDNMYKIVRGNIKEVDEEVWGFNFQ